MFTLQEMCSLFYPLKRLMLLDVMYLCFGHYIIYRQIHESGFNGDCGHADILDSVINVCVPRKYIILLQHWSVGMQ